MRFLHLGISVGFCGSVTTFSSWMYNVYECLAADDLPVNAGYKVLNAFGVVVVTIGMGFSSFVFGKSIGKIVFGDADEMIDGETLKLLTMESLKGMGIPMGHAMKILQRIKSEESDQPLTQSAVELTVQQPKVESGKLTDSLSTVPVTTISDTGNKSSLENSIGQENESTNNSEWSKFVGKHEYEGSAKENGINIVVVQTRKVVRSFAGKLAMAAVGVAASAGLGAIGGDLVAGVISSCSALCSH